MIHARHTIIHSPKVSPHPSPNLRVLLLNISLSTALTRLADIMLLLSLQLCVAVAGNACNDTLDGTGGTVGDARAEVVELTLGFLAFAFGILLGTSSLEVLLMKMSKPILIKRYYFAMT
jgi:hypothetical protein